MRNPAQKNLHTLILTIMIWGMFVLMANRVWAAAGINRRVNFQGKIVNKADGTNVPTTDYAFTFKLYDASSNGNQLPISTPWTENQTLAVTNGVFQATLGSVTPIPTTIDFNDDSLYLDITFDNETFTSRVRMTGVPYAFNAEKVGGIAGSALVINNPITGQTVTSTQTSGTILGITDAEALAGAVKGLVISLSGANAEDQTGLEFNLSNATGTNLNDILGTGSTWQVSKTGAATFVSATSPTYTGIGSVTLSSGGSSGLTLDSASGDILISANDGLTFAATTLGNNGSRNVTINAGTTGTTATLLVKLDTSGTVITTDTSTLNTAVGVALDTKTTGQAVRVAIDGVVTAMADNTVTAGDYIGIGTSTAGRAKSLGVTYPTTTGIQVIGRALSGTSVGNTFLLMLSGLDNNAGGGTGSSLWTADTGFSYLTNTTQDLVFGASTVANATFFMDVDAGLLYLGKNETTNGGLTFYSSGVGITDPSIFTNASGDLTLSAPSGQVVLGDGSGNINFSLTGATDVFLADKTYSLAGAYNATDYTFSRVLTGGANNQGGALFLISDTSGGAGTINPDMLVVNSDLTSGTFTGNLLRLQVGGVDKFLVDSAGAVTASGITATSVNIPTQIGIEANNLITSNGNGTANVAANTATFLNDAQTTYTQVTIAANAALALNDNAANYIVADRDTNTWAVLASADSIDYIRYIPYAEIYKSGNSLHVQMSLLWGKALTGNIYHRFQGTERYARESGFDSIAVDVNKNITINGGVVWAAFTRHNIAAVTSATTWFDCHHDSNAWHCAYNANTPVINNTQYDPGTDPTGLTDLNWTINYIYRGVEADAQDHLYRILGTTQYATLALAQASNTIASLPELISSHAMLVGRVIVQKNTTSNYTIESAFNTIYAGSSAITSHSSLTGLSTDDHTQYALLAGRDGGQTLIGGNTTESFLKLQGTSNNGTLASIAIQALVGNNGGTKALTILNNGNIGIGTTAPLTALDIVGSASSSGTLTFTGTTDPKINILNGENFGIALSPGGDGGLVDRFTLTSTGINSTNIGATTAGTGAFTTVTSPTYTGVGAVTLSSGGSSGLTLDSASGAVTLAASDALVITGGAGNPTATNGTVWYDTTANQMKIVENGIVKTVCNMTDKGCGAGGSGVSFASGTADNTTGTNNLIQLSVNSVNKFTVANSGGLTINGADSSIVRATTADFNLGTVGSNLTNSGDKIELADGTPANGGQGTISQTSINFTVSSGGAGAGSMTILRPDGKYLVILGGNAVTATCATAGTGMNVYDAMTGTTANFTGTGTQCIQTSAVGVGAIALPRADGRYQIIQGAAGAVRTILDPMGNTAPAVDGGANFCVSVGAGSGAYRRPDGKFLVVCGNGNTTSVVFDPVAGTWAAGPTVTASNTGGLVIPRPDGTALIVNGGSSVATTQIYNPYVVVANAITTGPSLDGIRVANTCSINNTPSLALKRQDGKFVILNRASAEVVYDPIANSMTCTGSVSNVSALGAGAHMIPIQNNKFAIFAGGGGATVFFYNQDSDTFSTNSAGAPNNIGAGAHSIMRNDGLWQIVTGGNSVTTNNYNGSFSMSDPFLSSISAAAPTSGGSCTAGAHSYYVTYVDGVESELSNKSNIVWCTAGLGTVVLSNIPLGPIGTTSRRIYRTVTGDTGLPKIVNGGSPTCVLNNNTSTTCTDTLADASLTTTYSITPATTWYTSEAIPNSYINGNSTLIWSAMLEAAYVAQRNDQTNTAFSPMQFFVRTAIDSGGCETPLSNAIWKEIVVSGGLIRAIPDANCVQVSVHFNRPLPKKLVDERNTFFGEGQVAHRFDLPTPTLLSLKIDNSAVLRRTGFDFNQSEAGDNDNPTIPSVLTSTLNATGGACTSGTHTWYVTFVTNGIESNLGTPSTPAITCNADGNDSVSLSAIPIGPSGTTARKIYRTPAGNSPNPFLLTTINDNSTLTFSDTVADTSLGAAYNNGETGPTLTRGEGSRVEAINGQLTLPFGRLPATTQLGTTGFYQGALGVAGPTMPRSTNDGTVVIARDDKQFLILPATGAYAILYDPATSTFTDQSGTGNVPTAAITAGAFAIKRPDGKFLVAVGGSTTTNIYNPYAPSGSRFTVGPPLMVAAGQGAFAILNFDGTYTILHGNGATTSSIYNPVKNNMMAGPVPTTGTNCGGLAIPLQGAFNNKYWVYPGAANGVAAVTATMTYDAVTKVFTGGTAITTGGGCGATAFQRQDGFWVFTYGESGTTATAGTLTRLINPYNATNAAAAPAPAACFGRGNQVIPRADGTFLFICGNAGTATTAVNAYVYFPWGGNNIVGAPIGTWSASIASFVTAGLNAGAVSFQRPDGKWVLLNSNTAGSAVTNNIDTGWYSDGQYLSGQIHVPPMAVNSTLDWQQAPDNYVRFEARTAASQTALGVTPYTSVGSPGESMGNAANDTWIQVQINMRRDFPTYCNNLDGVYASTGGMNYCYRKIATPMVDSYQVTNGMDLMSLQNNGLSVLRVTSNGNIMSSSTGGFFSGGADLAENYTSTDSLEKGEVVVMDKSGSYGVKRSQGQYQNDILGVVSTAPGFVAGSYTADSYPIALVGRVPVKISTENGMINQGDTLTSSSIPGYAMKATMAGRVLGRALESFDSAQGETCPAFGLGNVATTRCGTVMMFVNLADYLGQPVELVMTEKGQVLGLISEEQMIEGMGLETDPRIVNAGQILKFLTDLKAKQEQQSQTQSEIFTGRVAATNEVISPLMVTDLLVAKKIKAGSIEGLEIWTNKISSLEGQVAGLSTESEATPSAVIIGESTQATDSAGNKVIKFQSGVFMLDLSVLGKLKTGGGLVVSGDAEFKGKTLFQAMVEFFDKVIFRNEVNFDSRVTFNKDAAGVAVIPEISKSVAVVFEKEFEYPPIINISLKLNDATESGFIADDIRAAISNITTKGFIIILDQYTARDIEYNWIAMAVKDPTRQIGQSLVPEINKKNEALVKEEARPMVEASAAAIVDTVKESSPSAESRLLTALDNPLGYVKIREEPNAESGEMGEVTPGTSLVYSEEKYGWYKVTVGGEPGWMSGTYVKLN